MVNTLLGIFSNRWDAEGSISDLQLQGFNPQDISIIMRDQKEAQKMAHSSGAHVAEGAFSGIATGSLIGGVTGLLVGIGAIAVPGLGALLIGGPIAVALGLTGAAATTISGVVTGALAGGLVGALVGLGIPEKDAKTIESRIKEGGILIAIPVLAGEEVKARGILTKFNADMIRLISTNRDAEIQAPIVSNPPNYASQVTTPPAVTESSYFPKVEESYPDPIYYSDIRNPHKDESEKTHLSLKEKLKKLFR